MTRIIICLITLIFCTSASAQTIKGLVVDSLKHEPLVYATVRLLPAESENGVSSRPLRAGTTDAKGRFTLRAPKTGTYRLEVSAIGMESLTLPVTLSRTDETVDLDSLYIKEQASTLGAATVTAQKLLVKAEIDKLTYEVGEDPDATTVSTIEILRKVPMVTVDGEDKIKVNGNSSFQVYVNGKPNKMMTSNPSDILKTYPASAIKKIEVITNPGAKYDAEGVAGVLNIITNEETEQKGYTLTPSLRYGYTGWGASIFGMGQVGKFMISGNYGYGTHDGKEMTSRTEREVFADPLRRYYTESADIDSKGGYHFGSLEASYEMTKKDLLSLSAGVNAWDGDVIFSSITEMKTAEGLPYYSYRNWVKNEQTYITWNASLDYQHSFSDERRLTLSYRVSDIPTNARAEFLYSDATGNFDELHIEDQITEPDFLQLEQTAQIDFTSPFGKIHTFSTGLKYINRLNLSDSKEFRRPYATGGDFVYNDANSLRYRHRSDIAAAYAEYQLKKGNWGLQAGARYEFFRVKVSYPDGKRPGFTSNFSDFVPNVSLGYNLKPTMMFKLGYNMRLSRPSISFLTPYVQQTSPETLSYGNPDLGSEHAHLLTLSFNSFSPKLSYNVEVHYGFSNDNITNYSFLRDNCLHSTYGNFAKTRLAEIYGYLNWTISKTTTFNTNLNLSYAKISAAERGYRNNGFQFNGYAGLQQALPRSLSSAFTAVAVRRALTYKAEAAAIISTASTSDAAS